MPIQGNLEEAGLPDVLQLLSLGRKSGCLSVGDSETAGEIYLDVGRITFASVANRRDRLGDILVRNGRITREQLNTAADEQSRGSKRQIGQILVDSGRIDRRSLEKFFRLQVEEAVYFLFTLKQGEFTFTSDKKPPHQSLLVSLDPESLLLEGARRVDEWSLIQKKVPSFDLVYRLNKNMLKGAAAADLTEEQKRLLPLLDGLRDVTGLVDVTGMTEFDTGKALFGLVVAGFAQLMERRARVRHLDYRELLAYVVKEAEFVDAQRRREAGRHIVDCPTCADRLRRIHVRRTEGSPPGGTLEPATLETAALAAPPTIETAALTAPPAGAEPTIEVAATVSRLSMSAPAPAFPAPQAAPPAIPPVASRPSYADRRAGDRRTGYDRRQQERRAERERRQMVVAASQLSMEQRVQMRRKGERRTDMGRGQRAGDNDRRGGSVSSDAPVSRPPSRAPRTTGPRKLEPGAHREQAPRPVAVPVVEGMKTAAALRAQAVAEAARRVAEAPPPDQEMAVAADVGPREDEAPTIEVQAVEPTRAESPPPPTVQAAPPAPARTNARSKDIEWIISPDESVEMIRASRSSARPPNGAGRTSGKTKAPQGARPGAAPAPKPAAPAAKPTLKPAAAPAARHAAQAPPPLAQPRNGDAPAVSPVPATFTPAPRLEQAHLQPVEIVPAAAVPRPVQQPRQLVLPLRHVGIAAGIAALVLLSYFAGRRGGASGTGQAAGTTASNALPAAAAAAEAPPNGRAGNQRPGSSPAPTQQELRPPAPAPQRTPAQPPAVAAAPAPARQEPAPRVVPPAVALVPAPAPPPASRAVPPPAVQPAPGRPAPAPNAAPAAVTPAPPAAPTTGTVRGVVRDANGRGLAGAQVAVRGTSLSAVADGSGAYEIANVPDGPVTVQAAASGYVTASADTRARAGATVAADLALRTPPTSGEPDRELAAGGWATVDRAEAATLLGGTLGAIDGLSIESISKSTAGTRQRVRVVQLTETGDRIVLSETLAGAAVRAPGPVRLTALRIVPPSEAYPLSTGTASLGNLLITARSSLAPEALQALLQRLTDASH